MKKEEIYLDLSKLSSKQIKNVGNVLEDNSEDLYKNTKERLNNGVYLDTLEILVKKSEWVCASKYYYRGLRKLTEVTYNEFLSLFEKDIQEAWQPKKGEKVLVSRNREHWSECIFVLKYNGHFFTETCLSNKLIGWEFVKPFKEEKNWYRIKKDKDFYFIKLSEEDTLTYKVQDCEVVKITNSQLIELLENEIC